MQGIYDIDSLMNMSCAYTRERYEVYIVKYQRRNTELNEASLTHHRGYAIYYTICQR